MSKHTPGPWAISTDKFECGIAQGVRSKNGSICQINWMVRKRAPLESEANARLIAAAPEMLEVLREMAQPNNKAFITPRMALLIDSAIAKAEGRDK